MKSFFNIRWLLVPALLLAAYPVFAGKTKAPAFAGKAKAVTACETYITEPGKYRLVNDLENCDLFGVVIHASDVRLDLRGHTISCADNGLRSGGIATGIDLDPNVWIPVHNVSITNGAVTGCADGVLLAAAEDSSVTKITSYNNRFWDGPGSGTGITVWLSHHNLIMHNHAYGNAGHGIGSWESSGNLFKHNTTVDNGVGWSGSGLELVGETDSQFLCNRIHGNVDGIVLYPSTSSGKASSGNLLRGNLVTGNGFSGIGMMGFAWEGLYWLDIPDANTVRSNIVEGNSWNLYEIYYDLSFGDVLPHPEGTCMNDWMKNQYGPLVFGPDGCFGDPVMLDDDDVCALDEESDD